MKLKITREFQWDSAHNLSTQGLTEEENKNIFGPCYNVHGHRYKMFVTVSSKGKLQNGMIINFTQLKSIIDNLIVDRFDHKNLNDDVLYKERESTCENQVRDIWEILENELLRYDIILEEIKLYETPTSYATLSR